jgi:hypothetical protein
MQIITGGQKAEIAEGVRVFIEQPGDWSDGTVVSIDEPDIDDSADDGRPIMVPPMVWVQWDDDGEHIPEGFSCIRHCSHLWQEEEVYEVNDLLVREKKEDSTHE